MGTGTITAEQLAKTAAKATARRVTTATELGAGAAAAERFAPKVQEYFTNVVKNNDGRSTVVYMKPSEIMSEVGLKSIQGDDPLSGMQYQRMYRNKTLDKGITVDANVIDDGTLQLANADNPSLLNFLSVQGNDDAIPVVMRIGKGIPKDGTLPAYTNRGMRPIQYPHLAPTASAGAKVPDQASLKTSESISSVNNAPWISEATSTREYHIRQAEALSRDVQSTIPGIVYVNKAKATEFGDAVAEAFEVADKLVKEGASTSQIYNETSKLLKRRGEVRFSGITNSFPDGKLRVEHVTSKFGVSKEGVDYLRQAGLSGKMQSRPIGSVLDLPEDLMQAAPELRTLRMGFDPDLPKDTFGVYRRKTQEIMLSKLQDLFPDKFPPGPWNMNNITPDVQETVKSLMHEFNHSVDDAMGFAAGGNASQFTPEGFANFYETMLSVSEIQAGEAAGLIEGLMTKHGFAAFGSEMDGIQTLKILRKAADRQSDLGDIPEFLMHESDDLDEIASAYRAFNKDILKNPLLDDVLSVDKDIEVLTNIKERATSMYLNVYGEESANLAVYRMSKYRNVDQLRKMDPGEQMAMRNRGRNNLPTGAPPTYIDPKKIKAIEDEHFSRIKDSRAKTIMDTFDNNYRSVRFKEDR